MRTKPVSIAETVVHGVAFDPKNGQRVATMDLNELFASVGRLFDLLEERGIEHTLVGGIAMLSYVEGRNTQDVDLIVARADLPRLPELEVIEQNERFARCRFGELQVDLLFAEHEPFATVQNDGRTTRPFADRQVACATEQGLLLMKLYALPSLYRQGQLKKVRVYESDIADLLETPAAVSDEVWKRLASISLDSDIAELKRIVDDIQTRIDRASNRFGDAEQDDSPPA